MRRLLEVRGLVGGHRAPHVHTRLRAADGTRLVGTYLPSGGDGPAVLLAHGFAAHRSKPSYARLADGMATRMPVLALDLHGHDDAYFPVDDAQALAGSAGGPAALWLEPPGFGHAEDGLTPAFIGALTDAVTAADPGTGFPERNAART